MNKDDAVNLQVDVGGLKLKNPVVTASGTFGSLDEFSSFVDYNKIGAITTKSITLNPRVGNKAPRIWETSAGMMNAIGLENKGVKHFIENNIPYFNQFDTKLIVSIAGNEVCEYEELSKVLSSAKNIDALEINISCPNVKHGGIAFVQNHSESARIVELVKKHFAKPVFVKVSPEAKDMLGLVGDLVSAGANAITLINTLKAMAVDIHTGKPRLGNVTGGLSGPAIKPVAIRYLYELKAKYDVPVIAGGGIMNAEDALEFILVGAEAVSLGTVNFINPKAGEEVACGIRDFLLEKRLLSIDEFRGTLKV